MTWKWNSPLSRALHFVTVTFRLRAYVMANGSWSPSTSMVLVSINQKTYTMGCYSSYSMLTEYSYLKGGLNLPHLKTAGLVPLVLSITKCLAIWHNEKHQFISYNSEGSWQRPGKAQGEDSFCMADWLRSKDM